MADLSGIILTVLGVSFEATSTIYTYAKDAKHASKDIQQLSNEIFALIGEQTLSRDTDALSEQVLDERHLKVLKETLDSLNELLSRLTEPKSKLQKHIQRLKWPLKDTETAKYLQK
ncbi:MAG: hypothetical protein Q9191_001393 [Dirinaria sp. TL-2023a]